MRRGFTLVELLVASMITAFVLGSVSMSLRQIGRARETCKVRYNAHMRADTALNEIRRDIASIIRSDDLFYARLLLTDNQARGGSESFERDELLMFSNRLRPLRNVDFNGEGLEYETQYRIEEDRYGPVLWQRRDAFPDEYPGGGGVARPTVEGIVALSIQVYDGDSWFDDWDSDFDGLPLAVRVTVVASGNRGESDVYSAPRAILRTVIAIDRALSSRDWFVTPDDGTTPTNGNTVPDAASNEDEDGNGGPFPPGPPGRPGGPGGPDGPPRGGPDGPPRGGPGGPPRGGPGGPPKDGPPDTVRPGSR